MADRANPAVDRGRRALTILSDDEQRQLDALLSRLASRAPS